MGETEMQSLYSIAVKASATMVKQGILTLPSNLVDVCREDVELCASFDVNRAIKTHNTRMIDIWATTYTGAQLEKYRTLIAGAVAKGGNLALLTDLHHRGYDVSTNDVNFLAAHGRIPELAILHEWGINANYRGANAASLLPDLATLRLLHEWGIECGGDVVAVMAAGEGRLELLELMREWGHSIHPQAAIDAARGGHVEILLRLHEWEVPIGQSAARMAAIGMHIDTVRLLHGWGVDPERNFVNQICEHPREAPLREMLTLLHEYGIHPTCTGALRARRAGHVEIARLIESWL